MSPSPRIAPSQSPHRRRSQSRRGTRTRLRQSGFSLLEILIVVGILSITALIAMPSVAPNQSVEREVASVQLSEALRFAREEAIRTGVRHGVELDLTGLTVKVFRNEGGTTRIFDVRHPLTRNLYDAALVRSTSARDITVTPSTTWSASCAATDDIGFDAWGSPRCASDWNARLMTSIIRLELAGTQSTISVESETGRIVVQ